MAVGTLVGTLMDGVPALCAAEEEDRWPCGRTLVLLLVETTDEWVLDGGWVILEEVAEEDLW